MLSEATSHSKQRASYSLSLRAGKDIHMAYKNTLPVGDNSLQSPLGNIGVFSCIEQKVEFNTVKG